MIILVGVDPIMMLSYIVMHRHTGMMPKIMATCPHGHSLSCKALALHPAICAVSALAEEDDDDHTDDTGQAAD